MPPDLPDTPPSGRAVALGFGRLSAGWWRDARTRRRAWWLTAALALGVLANIGAILAVNRWNRVFFDAFERRDAGTLATAVLVFGGLVVAVAAVGVAIVLARETLQVRWREWLVQHLLDLWLARTRYHRLQLARTEPANPEYRIADDARMATEPLVDFAIGLLHALLTAVAFVTVLWSVGGALTFTVGGSAVTIPAYMVLAALLYGVLASALMLRVGRPLVAGIAAKNEAEAKLRFELTRLRENAESVALIRGERDERAGLDRTYGELARRWLTVVRLHGRLTWISNGSGALLPVVPLLLATPKYLSGDLSLGAVTQLAAAFVQVQLAFAWLVDNYRAVAQWHASARRVLALSDAIADLDGDGGGAVGIRVEAGAGERVEVIALTATDRAGQAILADVTVLVEPGEAVLVTGESGIGKSTLVRAISGIWPWGRGLVRLPSGMAPTVVPQRPYLPLGPLRLALAYPDDAAAWPDQGMAAALVACGLPGLATRLDEVERWDQVLSSGERQRLAFARLLLQRPGLIVLDEATSALDEASQAHLMALLRREMPDATVISIGHRAGLEPFHDRVLRLARDPDGVARLEEVTRPLPGKLRVVGGAGDPARA